MKKPLKPKACKSCGKEYMPRATTQTACSALCALNLIAKKKIAVADKQSKQERKADNEKREALKSRREVLNDAQRIFNKFIRLRDELQPCISCGEHRNTYDAGHYRSVGAAPQLRFNEDNCHKQCVQCNQHKSGNAIEYRIGLVKRIGTGRVEALECSNQAVKWTAEDGRRIKAQYQDKIKQLRVQQGEKT